MRSCSRHTKALIAACLTMGVLAGCADEAGTPVDGGPPRPPASQDGAVSAPVTKVLVVIEENHTLDQMHAGMPYLASLADQYGYATHWRARAHPSEPNYLAIVGGSTFGVTDDATPSVNARRVGQAQSIFGQALAAGKSAHTYAESMPENCHQWDHPEKSVGKPSYAARHNPWVYFTAERAQCLEDDTDLSTFAADAASDTLPDIGLLIPDLTHDAHDASLTEADAWLERQLAPVLAGDDFRSGRLAVVVTADEDDRLQDNTVLTAVLHVGLTHKVVDTPLTHYSLTRFMAEVIGVEPLGEGRGAPDMRAAFGL
ncbi:hypothetical protein ASD30_12010 [Nocardioides sp. Root140]|nr:hypothetical protein ASD30_12010 [Nocardioides sp. Root140]KRF13110.1 hypothetical protein ASH02_16655 [Nocardioides sp. Soil796]